jgi:AcrR family transcriptional regulator
MATTARGRDTRLAFRDGARKVIAEKGFLRTTIGEIAETAGRSPASFYNYYESKEALLEELAEEFRQDALQRAQPAYKSGTPVWDVMLDSARAYWTSYREHLAELVGVFQTAMIDERFAARWREIRLAGIETIRDGIERAQSQGFCPGVDPWLTAGALGSMFEHFCYVSLAQGGAFADRPFDEEEAIRTIASIWYHAVYWTERDSPVSPALRG